MKFKYNPKCFLLQKETKQRGQHSRDPTRINNVVLLSKAWILQEHGEGSYRETEECSKTKAKTVTYMMKKRSADVV